MLHGTQNPQDFDPTKPNPDSGDFNLCLCDDIEVVDSYTQLFNDEEGYEGSEVFEVELRSDLTVCSQDELLEVCEEMGIDTEYEVVYTLVDKRSVRDELRSRGFDVVDHIDEVPGIGEHDTRRVIREGVVTSYQPW